MNRAIYARRRLVNRTFLTLSVAAAGIGILALALIGVPILVLQPEGLPRMRALERELADVKSENVELRRSVTQLRDDVKHLRDDPAAVDSTRKTRLTMRRRA